jgi:ABC-2 type transport system ATP-binding protein
LTVHPRLRTRPILRDPQIHHHPLTTNQPTNHDQTSLHTTRCAYQTRHVDKTTAIKAILGLVRKQAGTIKVFGQERQFGRMADSSRVGAVFDAPPLLGEWTTAQAGQILAPFYPAWDGERYLASLERFGLARAKKVGELSRGMKVKLQLALALSHGAELLVLDEPTSGLDPVFRDELCELLVDFVADERRGVLFSTHVTADLERIADYITLIQDGVSQFSGPKDELLERYARVAGGPDDLDSASRGLVHGCRRHATGFEGLVEVGRAADLPAGVVCETATLDEIVLFLSRKGKGK